ncbi:phosphoribosylanthranilate isomerase [Mobilitalea sibirica]|uniref:N-(5'-phosphoribosyl)anthranilate isomerase n=1 Tax=Mobilitalea sibirica TaxID=1462919 RepID=A0A8J7HE89_9FIRM|nr:phosphoribosylanthranilate isomerase [Mobilitalea sibirica]MBH1941749.1 phosphoribosylanthranilate isomerase [Mobilitalea sibirica]
MVNIKICGLMKEEDVNLCVNSGVNIVGFVVEYPVPVPWNLDVLEARELISTTPAQVKTCVVTGGTIDKVLQIAKETSPDIIQLHYKENLEETVQIAKELKQLGIETIKALRINDRGFCDFEISDPAMAARELSKTGITAILVDTYTNAMPGGTGMNVNFHTFHKVKDNSTLPVILAGGLNPVNIIDILSKTNPDAVDVLTGVEQSPGYKEKEKIEQFVNKIRLGR